MDRPTISGDTEAFKLRSLHLSVTALHQTHDQDHAEFTEFIKSVDANFAQINATLQCLFNQQGQVYIDISLGRAGLSNCAHEMLDTASTLQGRVLTVVMHNVKNTATLHELNHLFSVFGVVERIYLPSIQLVPNLFIQYQHNHMADKALSIMQGRHLFYPSCQLSVRHVFPCELQTFHAYRPIVLQFQKSNIQIVTPNTATSMREESSARGGTLLVHDKSLVPNNTLEQHQVKYEEDCECKSLVPSPGYVVSKDTNDADNTDLISQERALDKHKLQQAELNDELQCKEQEKQSKHDPKQREHFPHNAAYLFDSASASEGVSAKENINILVPPDCSVDEDLHTANDMLRSDSSVSQEESDETYYQVFHQWPTEQIHLEASSDAPTDSGNATISVIHGGTIWNDAQLKKLMPRAVPHATVITDNSPNHWQSIQVNCVIQQQAKPCDIFNSVPLASRKAPVAVEDITGNWSSSAVSKIPSHHRTIATLGKVRLHSHCLQVCNAIGKMIASGSSSSLPITLKVSHNTCHASTALTIARQANSLGNCEMNHQWNYFKLNISLLQNKMLFAALSIMATENFACKILDASLQPYALNKFANKLWDPGDIYFLQSDDYVWNCLVVASKGQGILLPEKCQADEQVSSITFEICASCLQSLIEVPIFHRNWGVSTKLNDIFSQAGANEHWKSVIRNTAIMHKFLLLLTSGAFSVHILMPWDPGVHQMQLPFNITAGVTTRMMSRKLLLGWQYFRTEQLQTSGELPSRCLIPSSCIVLIAMPSPLYSSSTLNSLGQFSVSSLHFCCREHDLKLDLQEYLLRIVAKSEDLLITFVFVRSYCIGMLSKCTCNLVNADIFPSLPSMIATIAMLAVSTMASTYFVAIVVSIVTCNTDYSGWLTFYYRKSTSCWKLLPEGMSWNSGNTAISCGLNSMNAHFRYCSQLLVITKKSCYALLSIAYALEIQKLQHIQQLPAIVVTTVIKLLMKWCTAKGRLFRALLVSSFGNFAVPSMKFQNAQSFGIVAEIQDLQFRILHKTELLSSLHNHQFCSLELSDTHHALLYLGSFTGTEQYEV